MIAEAIDKILVLSNPELYKFGDRQYATKQLVPVKNPRPEPLEISTLTSLVGYLQDNKDALNLEHLIVHVAGVANVVLMSRLQSPWLTRDSYLQVKTEFKQFPFGQYLDVESFIIALQSQFVQDEMTAVLLRMVGNLKDENVGLFGDDGTSQQVTVKTGISTVKNVPVPNPIVLAPYRTFREIDQPASRFVFRMKNGPVCALFEADGGAWKNEAVLRVKAYLQEKSPGVTVIA